MMKYKYSVIIPIYNSEQTLEKCLLSLALQTRNDTEIIMVNDGSTDSSSIICQKYSKSYNAFKLINKNNGGVSSARNLGLDIAQGEYITFVDSDDYVSSDYFLAMDTVLNETSYDMVFFAYYRVKNNCKENLELRQLNEMRLVSRKDTVDFIIKAICRKKINAPWAKLYRAEIIKKWKIRFPENLSNGEDRVFNIEYSFYVNKLRVSQQVVYYVSLENENSLSRKNSKDFRKQFTISDQLIRETLLKCSIDTNDKKKYQEALDFNVCTNIIKDTKDLHRNNIQRKERLRIIDSLCEEINARNMSYPKSIYCQLIGIIVKLHMKNTIDLIALKLAK